MSLYGWRKDGVSSFSLQVPGSVLVSVLVAGIDGGLQRSEASQTLGHQNVSTVDNPFTQVKNNPPNKAIKPRQPRAARSVGGFGC